METKQTIKKNQNIIKNAGCGECLHCNLPSHDYESGYIEPGCCSKEGNENYGNLKSFPFKKHKDCFNPDMYFLMHLDKDITDLHDLATRKDFSAGVAYDNDIINKEEKSNLENKAEELYKNMRKLTKERYGF